MKPTGHNIFGVKFQAFFEIIEEITEEQASIFLQDQIFEQYALIYSCIKLEEENRLKIECWMWVDSLNDNFLFKTQIENFCSNLECKKFRYLFYDQVQKFSDDNDTDFDCLDNSDQSFISQNREVLSLIGQYHKLCKRSERGCGRIVFLDQKNGWVYKIPTRKRGVKDNLTEARIYHTNKDKIGDEHIRLAECYIYNEGESVPILKMELLDKNIFAKDLIIPEWAENIDQLQIGLNKQGEIKAYDLY